MFFLLDCCEFDSRLVILVNFICGVNLLVNRNETTEEIQECLKEEKNQDLRVVIPVVIIHLHHRRDNLEMITKLQGPLVQRKYWKFSFCFICFKYNFTKSLMFINVVSLQPIEIILYVNTILKLILNSI